MESAESESPLREGWAACLPSKSFLNPIEFARCDVIIAPPPFWALSVDPSRGRFVRARVSPHGALPIAAFVRLRDLFDRPESPPRRLRFRERLRRRQSFRSLFSRLGGIIAAPPFPARPAGAIIPSPHASISRAPEELSISNVELFPIRPSRIRGEGACLITPNQRIRRKGVGFRPFFIGRCLLRGIRPV